MAIAEKWNDGDWTMPATKAELMVVKSDLGGQIKDVDVKIDRVAADLGGQIKGVDVKIDRVAADLGGQIKDVDIKIDRVAADLGGQIKDVTVDLTREMAKQGHVLGSQMQEVKDGLARQRVATVWMGVGVTTLLASLITVLQFFL